MIKSNKELKSGQIIKALISGKITECAVIGPLYPGYSKLLVRDADPDITTISTINNTWFKHLKRNHARGAEYTIHINQIK